MPNKNKNSNGPKTDEGKAISSRNSVTHGLTARRWLNADEQSLFDETVKNLIVDFDPQTSIEKMLITKMAECSVRLMRIQNRENAMFDLASSEAGHPEESIRSLDNSSERLIQAVRDTVSADWQYNPVILSHKFNILDEVDNQNLDDVSGWVYIEQNMPRTSDYIINKCVIENIDLYEYISKETGKSSNIKIEIIGAGESSTEELLTTEDILKDTKKIKSSALQEYLEIVVHRLAKDIQVQYILKDLDKRTQQIRDAAIPDTQKLSLVQRYRTADERQFSKTLGELLELQKRRSTI